MIEEFCPKHKIRMKKSKTHSHYCPVCMRGQFIQKSSKTGRR